MPRDDPDGEDFDNPFDITTPWINDIVSAPEDKSVREKMKGEIAEVTKKMPLYPELLKGL